MTAVTVWAELMARAVLYLVAGGRRQVALVGLVIQVPAVWVSSVVTVTLVVFQAMVLLVVLAEWNPMMIPSSAMANPVPVSLPRWRLALQAPLALLLDQSLATHGNRVLV